MNIKSFLFYVMIIIVVALSIYMIFWTKSDGEKCLVNPLVFGVQNLQSNSNDSITCSCSSPLSSKSIIVNSTGMSYSSYNNYGIHISNISIT